MSIDLVYSVVEIVVMYFDYGFIDVGIKIYVDFYDFGVDIKCRYYFFIGCRECQRNNVLFVLGVIFDINLVRYQ